MRSGSDGSLRRADGRACRQALRSSPGKPAKELRRLESEGVLEPRACRAVLGQEVLARAYGMADLEHDVRNTPVTIFEPGSVSKQFTATATILLAPDGRISLDDDVRKYIPEIPDYGTPITIRDLLNHTSGLRDRGSVAGIGSAPKLPLRPGSGHDIPQ